MPNANDNTASQLLRQTMGLSNRLAETADRLNLMAIGRVPCCNADIIEQTQHIQQINAFLQQNLAHLRMWFVGG